MTTNIDKAKKKDFKIRILQSFIVTFVLVIVLKLLYLQIFSYKTISERAQYSTSRISIVSAPRGIIYDRNGNILATNKQSISVVAYPDKLKTLEERIKVLDILTKILKTDQKKLKEILLKLPENAPFPIRLVSNISIEEAIPIVEKQHLLPGINIQEEPMRYYPNTSLASHVLGYISQIDEEELIKRTERRLGDLVGKYGIEKLYDDILRGTDGKKIVGVDRFGKPISGVKKHSEIEHKHIAGKNIYLTIDLSLQNTVEKALKEEKFNSSAIVVNPNTGEILALANYPDFNPNTFTKPFSENIWNILTAKKAFLNRALLAYTPGSIWKPIVLISALDAMAVKTNESFKVSEALYLGRSRFGDWTSKTGILSLQEALAWSRDTAFYQIGQRLTPKQIKKWGLILGAGRKTGIELLGEEEGIVPDEEWKKKNTGEPWYPGNTLHYSIGQNYLLVTPVQMARIFSAIANGDKVPKLHIVKKVHNYNETTPSFETYNLAPEMLRVVKEGLEMCVESGTGQASKLKGIKIAGKTGSAEVPGSNKTHGWFAAYAPAENPEIVVVVLAEKAGHGGSVAAPIARKILEKYFEDRMSTNEQLARN